MARERLPMRKIREILRLKWILERSNRETARSLGISAGAVSQTVVRAKQRGLDWVAVCGMNDEQLDTLLYGAKLVPGAQRPLPDPSWMHRELRRTGVTLELLHLEYLERQPDGYRYTSFCNHYRRWLKARGLSMRHLHRAGEKLFVDYSGKRPHIMDSKTGEIHEVELFVAVLGASNYTYAEATRTQKSHDWIQSHVRAFEFLGGVTQLIVPDQLRSGVSRPCRYEPQVQRTYEELACHYGTAVLPARPAKAKDKAKVEVAVQIVQRWILACLRNETFFTLDALNERIGELLERLNNRPMKDYGGASRRELFEKIDAPALRAMPSSRFVYAEWKKAKVNIDYHVEVHKHYYSVPYALARESVEARITAMTVEIFHNGHRVASHRRNDRPGLHTTDRDHMPKSHQKHLEWTPSRLLNWAGKIGPRTRELTDAILRSRPHPEMGYRSVLGLLRLAKRYDEARLEMACARALTVGARSYRHVASILKNGLDRVPVDDTDSQPSLPLDHANVRGSDYFH
jgi:transposase